METLMAPSSNSQLYHLQLFITEPLGNQTEAKWSQNRVYCLVFFYDVCTVLLCIRFLFGGWTSCVVEADLRGADFVECDKDGGVEEAAERQVSVKGHWGHQQQKGLRQEGSQAQREAPRTLRHQIQHVEVWWEVVANVAPGQVIQVRLVEEFPAVPGLHTEYVRRKN